MAIGSDARELAQALAEPTFFHAYQPIVQLETAQVVSAEALIRWEHPELGLLMPDTFLPLIYGAGLSLELTRFGVRQVLTDLPELRRIYGDTVTASLNLSQRQLLDPAVVTRVILDEFDTSGESPASLLIEVVEDVTSTDLRRSADAFAELRSKGVQIVLDDFGTGASSLTMLTEAAYDGLKIDRSFIQGIVSNTTARSVVESVLTFGRATGISVVAEGVESSLELQALTDLGCTLGQGYHFGRPTPLDQHTGAPAFTPVEPRQTMAATVLAAEPAELEAILHSVDAIDPRSAVHDFESTFEQLMALDAEALRFGQAAGPARCEIGTKIAVAATYHGRHETTVTWAMRTSRLAEDLERWGRSAEMLSLVAGTPWEHGGNPALPVDALTRALQLRITKPMGLAEGTRVDNAIGVTFAAMGLVDHSWRWWKESATRHGDSKTFGSAMCCLNFAELQLEALEGEIETREMAPRAIAIAFLDQILDRLEENPFAPQLAAVSLRCRLEVAKGNLDAAVAASQKITEPSIDFVSRSMTLRARAQLARAQGDNEQFLKHTTALTEVLADRPLLNHHDWYARTLHAQALLANGRTGESAELSQQLLRSKQAKDNVHLTTLLEWIRLKVDLNVRYDEMFANSTIESERTT